MAPENKNNCFYTGAEITYNPEAGCSGIKAVVLGTRIGIKMSAWYNNIKSALEKEQIQKREEQAQQFRLAQHFKLKREFKKLIKKKKGCVVATESSS